MNTLPVGLIFRTAGVHFPCPHGQGWRAVRVPSPGKKAYPDRFSSHRAQYRARGIRRVSRYNEHVLQRMVANIIGVPALGIARNTV